jgi:hypothetical protein
MPPPFEASFLRRRLQIHFDAGRTKEIPSTRDIGGDTIAAWTFLARRLEGLDFCSSLKERNPKKSPSSLAGQDVLLDRGRLLLSCRHQRDRHHP